MMPTRGTFAAPALPRGHAVAATKAAIPPRILMISLRTINLVPTPDKASTYCATCRPSAAPLRSAGNTGQRPSALGYLDAPRARRERIDQRVGLSLVCAVEIGVPFIQQID